MRWLWTVAACAAGLALAVAAWHFNWQRLCLRDDMAYLELCPALPAAARQIEQLREQVQRNPGDSVSWVALTPLEHGGPRHAATLAAASQLAPTHPEVQLWRAIVAARDNRPGQAVALLVDLTEHHRMTQAAQALAALLASPEGTDLLQPYLKRAPGWLPLVLGSMPSLKLPPGLALPLMLDAVAEKALPTEESIQYLGRLRDAGSWVEAYALWTALNNGKVPLLYNASFDRAFVPRAFDWELASGPPSRMGAIAQRRTAAQRGAVLDIAFTGKPIALPVVRQYVLVSPGRYSVRGHYMAQKLRSSEGLAWVLQCTDGSKAVAGRSQGLNDTRGNWARFSFEADIPADCGFAASLQLETASPYEARSGIRGEASFDAMEFVRTGG